MLQMVPTFYPTMEEFSKFTDYVNKIKEFCNCGLAKIVPPKEWTEGEGMEKVRKRYDKIDNYKIMNPIKQMVVATKGAYRVQNEIFQNSMPVTSYKLKSDEQLSKCKYLKKDETEDSIRRKFWKNVTFAPPIYGADSSGTLFEDDVKEWNLNNLDDLLKVVGEKVPGINTPYLYFGMWKALFAIHCEDMDLYSINYLHFGENKIWYCIPEKDSSRFESFAKSTFPLDFKECDQFLRHKSYLFSPSLLHDNNITVSTATQHAGEFMITFPKSYHFGFNCGFNCAEAVNFALDNWINYGKKAKICLCSTDSPRIPMDYFTNPNLNANLNTNLNNTNNEIIHYNNHSKLFISNDHSSQVQHTHHPVLSIDPQQHQKNLQDFNTALENKKQFDEKTNSTWTINCTCGLQQIHSPESVKTISHCTIAVTSGILFECGGCYCWCHVECFPRYQGLNPLPVEMFCHECDLKKNNTNNDNNNTIDENVSPKKRKNESTKSTKSTKSIKSKPKSNTKTVEKKSPKKKSPKKKAKDKK